MRIRKATIKDFEKLKKIKILSKKEELKYSETLKPIVETKHIYYEYLRLDLTKPNRAIFIAEEDNKVTGIILCKFFKPLRIVKHNIKGHISNLYILKEYRKKGVAKKLVKEAIEWLKKQNVPHISLEIHTENLPAQSLYHNFGFKNYTIKMTKRT